MSSLAELAGDHAALDDADLAHLHRLLAEWQALADLSFADLLLLLPASAGGGGWRCAALVRPATGPTLHTEDPVGLHIEPGRREAVDLAWAEQRIARETDPVWREEVPVREEAIPVRSRPGGAVIAVLARDTNLAALRAPSALELAYLAAASDLAQMVADGRFPWRAEAEPEAGLTEAPRVGDGLLRVDQDGVVSFASPNAQSALRRLGLRGNLTGATLTDLLAALPLVEEDVVEPPTARLRQALAGQRPAEAELAAADGDAAVRLRAVPLLPGGRPLGALVLLRDVTEVRRRDRALLSKDATIREIHHRVKNNLQTVAALLRLQSRRTEGREARAALEESVRRVTSIAVVHETLSQALEDSVGFDGIADSVVALSLDLASWSANGGHPSARRLGSFGVLPATVATPLALVLSELVSNAVEHAYAGGAGEVRLFVQRRPQSLEVVVSDDGPGPPAGGVTNGLGLQIVRTLVVGELRGTFSLGAGAGRGTDAVVTVPQ